jgi:hypothetical protein
MKYCVNKHDGDDDAEDYASLQQMLMFEGSSWLTCTLFFTQRIYMPESPNAWSFSRYSPFTLPHFLHCPRKLLMPAA